MACPECGGATVRYVVPEDLRTYAPESTDIIALCGDCLHVSPATVAGEQADEANQLVDVVPNGDGGAALAVALGLLDSLALNRSGIVECLEYAEESGVDVHLSLDRLAHGFPDAHVDLERRRSQLTAFF